jgi:homocitrate synthase
VRTQSMEDVDTVLRVYHTAIHSGELGLGQSKRLDELLQRHREASVSAADRRALPQAVQA